MATSGSIPGRPIILAIEIGHFGAKPTQVEDPVDTNKYIVLGQKIAKRSRNEQLQLIPFLPTQHAHPPRPVDAMESATPSFFNSPRGTVF